METELGPAKVHKPVRYRVITPHILRRNARKEKARIERLLLSETPEAEAELQALNVDPSMPLRISPKRWQGYWRVEQMV